MPPDSTFFRGNIALKKLHFSVNLGSQVLIKTITASSDSTISFVDGASSVVFDPNTGEAKILNRQVVGDNFKGAGGDGTGDASVAKTLFQEQKQTQMFDTGEVPSAVVYNNQNTNVGGSSQTISGFVTNKNVDNTFINCIDTINRYKADAVSGIYHQDPINDGKTQLYKALFFSVCKL